VLYHCQRKLTHLQLTNVSCTIELAGVGRSLERQHTATTIHGVKYQKTATSGTLRRHTTRGEGANAVLALAKARPDLDCVRPLIVILFGLNRS